MNNIFDFARKIKGLVLGSHISRISRRVKEKKLTYLSYQKILNLENCIKDIANKNISGACIEAGVALGGSAIIISGLMPSNCHFYGYDVFEMIPPPSDEDDKKSKTRYEVIRSGKSRGIGGDEYYGYVNNLYEKVIENFQLFNLEVDEKRISLYKGLFQETMKFSQKENIALAHIDCDWYEPVYFCLSKIYPILSKGGYLIIDDYYCYGGAKKAVDKFLLQHNDLIKIISSNHLVLMRQ